MDVITDLHDILEVVVRLVKCRVKNNAQELDADFVLLLEFRPNSFDHSVDAIFSEVNANKSIILGAGVLVIEDPWVVQEVHDVHPTGFITFESRKRRSPPATGSLPHFTSSDVVPQGFVEVVAARSSPSSPCELDSDWIQSAVRTPLHVQHSR